MQVFSTLFFILSTFYSKHAIKTKGSIKKESFLSIQSTRKPSLLPRISNKDSYMVIKTREIQEKNSSSKEEIS